MNRKQWGNGTGSHWMAKSHEVNQDYLYSIAEWEQVQVHPQNKGFMGVFVESIMGQAPGSESFKVVFNIVGTGIHY
jgi:hypothetical protein